MQIRRISPELFHFTSLPSSKIDTVRALIVKRGIVPVGIIYISLSSALCQVNAVRSERFRSDGVILDERMNLVNFYNAKRYIQAYRLPPFVPRQSLVPLHHHLIPSINVVSGRLNYSKKFNVFHTTSRGSKGRRLPCLGFDTESIRSAASQQLRT